MTRVPADEQRLRELRDLAAIVFTLTLLTGWLILGVPALVAGGA